MTTSPLTMFMEHNKRILDDLLVEKTARLRAPKILREAMTYSLQAGGKRLRPILLLATLEAFDVQSEVGLPVACALEMLHTYSLIHDDLPSMDDDALRRGKPTNHIVYGEANAILAGDALLTYSFEIIASQTDPRVTSEMKIELIRLLAQAAGAEGMVGGQVEDLLAENNSNLTLQQLQEIHANKTGKLLSYPILAAGILANANEMQQQHLAAFAKHIGIAFQIRDDILDIEGDAKKMGKPVGSDSNNQKSTYPALLTLHGAKKKLNDHINIALENLHKANIKHHRLEKITMFIMHRDN